MSKRVLMGFVIALGLGAGGGYWLAQQQSQDMSDMAPATEKEERKPLFYRNPMNPAITSPVPAKDNMGMAYIPVYAEDDKPAATEREVLFYRNPMNPNITSPVPAQDEMGMDYIPVYADADESSGDVVGTVKIDPVTVQNIGVRSAQAERRVLSRRVRAVGRVDYDEERLARLHPKVDGWVEKLMVEKTGEQVKKGTILLEFYSPQLVSSQQEYLLALSNYENLKDSPFDDISEGAEEMIRSTRERLELLDVPAHQIKELEQSRKIKKALHIHSPFDGIVMNMGVREGQYIGPKTELYMLADLSEVWVYVDIYEYELPWITVGDEADMRVAAVPGKTFTGKVTYIYPYMESETRTIRIRMEFDNTELLLKPNMFANVTVHAGQRVEAVVVPSEAIVRSGSREQVFLVRGAGKFEPRNITVGLSADGFTQVLEGVEPGDEVVTSSQFLIDSESKLREATAKMLEALSAEEQDTSQHNGHIDMKEHVMDQSAHDHADMEGHEMDHTAHDHGDSAMDAEAAADAMNHADH